jgi:hypothetical protein
MLDHLDAPAAGANHRVVSPFPVKLEAGKAVIQAKKGAAYQVLVDGNRVVDVKSAGTDTVPVE